MSLLERQRVEEGLDRGLSMRRIGELIGRSASTVAREIGRNKTRRTTKALSRRHCAERAGCDVKGLCGDACPHEGRALCSRCAHRQCTNLCARYAFHTTCHRLASPPHVCNGCERRRACRSHGREQQVYDASAADASAKARRSESRSGIDMTPDEAARALGLVKDGLARGLSPYEMTRAYGGELPVSPSTIYRWVDRGYGDAANIELERKVGFKPRKKSAPRRPTAHAGRRAYARFSELPEEARAARAEMDTVVGRKGDGRCVLTLYLAPSHFQFFLLLEEKTEDAVIGAIRQLRKSAGEDLFSRMFPVVVTDNGSEFADERRLARAFMERAGTTRLFYCDVRASEQKGACEKNHSELRQLLPKGSVSFDELVERDMAVCMSHVNSSPRASLCGASPTALFKAMFGEAGRELLDAYGVEEVPGDRLALRPIVLNVERDRRGEGPLRFL